MESIGLFYCCFGVGRRQFYRCEHHEFDLSIDVNNELLSVDNYERERERFILCIDVEKRY